MAWGSGAKNLNARKSPDMLGSKMGTKMVPVRALKAPSTILRAKFRGDAIRNDGRSPNPLFGVETAGFRANFFCIFFFLAPLTKEKPPYDEVHQHVASTAPQGAANFVFFCSFSGFSFVRGTTKN